MSTHRSQPVLEASSLNRFLGTEANQVHVLRDLSLQLDPAQVYSIAGPSGCGKSTLLYILGLLDQPDSGEIKIQGQSIDHSDDSTRTAIRNEHIGFVFQFHFLLAEFSVLENVILPMKKLGRKSASEMKDKAYELLKEVGLDNKNHRLANQLSGGEQQRVAIARALANSPSIIFADEPTGNLDVKNSNIVFDLIKKLAYQHNQAVLIVTHSRELARNCDYTFTMKDGQFVG